MGHRTGSHTVDPASCGGQPAGSAAFRRCLRLWVPPWPDPASFRAGPFSPSVRRWPRRERRIAEARDLLRIACQMLGAMGMEAFAERARRELLTTGETARKRTAQPPARRPARLANR
jgi:hypothetical protein